MKLLAHFNIGTVSDFAELVTLVQQKFLAQKWIKPSFKAAILAREKIYPTGLKLAKINVALPHADPEHVRHNGIVIVETARPIKMVHMATKERYIDCQYFFFLLVKDASLQVDVLTRLMKNLQDDQFLHQLWHQQLVQYMKF